MSDADQQDKQRERQIAHNESDRQARSAARVSSSAIFAAVIVALLLFGMGWMMLR